MKPFFFIPAFFTIALFSCMAAQAADSNITMPSVPIVPAMPAGPSGVYTDGTPFVQMFATPPGQPASIDAINAPHADPVPGEVPLSIKVDKNGNPIGRVAPPKMDNAHKKRAEKVKTYLDGVDKKRMDTHKDKIEGKAVQ